MGMGVTFESLIIFSVVLKACYNQRTQFSFSNSACLANPYISLESSLHNIYSQVFESNTSNELIKGGEIVKIPFGKQSITVDTQNKECIPECYINCQTQFKNALQFKFCVLNLCHCIEVKDSLPIKSEAASNLNSTENLQESQLLQEAPKKSAEHPDIRYFLIGLIASLLIFIIVYKFVEVCLMQVDSQSVLHAEFESQYEIAFSNQAKLL